MPSVARELVSRTLDVMCNQYEKVPVGYFTICIQLKFNTKYINDLLEQLSSKMAWLKKVDCFLELILYLHITEY